MQINWQQFGLKTNPYDTNALVEGGTLSLEEAFIGRQAERKILNDLFESDDRVCLTICGETGVGKTSLANAHKHLWKYKREKLLFSCRREMEVSDTHLDKQSFILEIISSVLREIKLLQPELLKKTPLFELQQIVDISQTMAISGGLSISADVFGGGIDFSHDKKNSTPFKLTSASLEQHFSDLLNFIKTHEIGEGKDTYTYSGLIVHVNNFDVVLKKPGHVDKVRQFFHEIRDILQIKDVYFLFLGPEDLYSQIIAKEQRVKSVFALTPLLVKPLSKKEVAYAFERRLELLQSENVKQYIKPIEDEVVFRLHDLYEGDIRSIMTGIKDILGQCSDHLLQPLNTNEAMVLLGRERWEKIETNLSKEQKKVLESLIVVKQPISGIELSKLLGKPASNISSYYVKPLKNLGVVEEKEKRGNTIYFGLTKEYEPLRWWFESEKDVQKDAEEAKGRQPTLFD